MGNVRIKLAPVGFLFLATGCMDFAAYREPVSGSSTEENSATSEEGSDTPAFRFESEDPDPILESAGTISVVTPTYTLETLETPAVAIQTPFLGLAQEDFQIDLKTASVINTSYFNVDLTPRFATVTSNTLNLSNNLLTVRTDLLGKVPTPETSWCVRGDTQAECNDAEKNNRVGYRHILVLPIGYKSSEYQAFRDDFQRMIEVSGDTPGNPYSEQHRGRILYWGWWTPGSDLEGDSPAFGGRIIVHPFRGTGITIDLDAVIEGTERYMSVIEPLSNPWAVVALYNTMDAEPVPNASPPGFLGRPYGIAKMTKGHLYNYKPSYTMAHEVGHAGLNFLDEYIEEGFENLNINSFNAATFSILLNGTWSGFGDAFNTIVNRYQFRLSEILAGNGNENIDVTEYPDRVWSPHSPDQYAAEGGMFFGRGTYHQLGDNLMNSSRTVRMQGDSFAYEHSISQKRVVKQAFEEPWSAPRANNRIRNAGPTGKLSWANFGNRTTVLLYDGDKNHHYHPTTAYQVKVAYCPKLVRSCKDSEWRYWTSPIVLPSRNEIELEQTALFGLASFIQRTACAFGVRTISDVQICEDTLSGMADKLLPTMVFPLPYQKVEVPTEAIATKYFWQFRTYNGTHWSGWTGWSHFSRAL